MQQAIIIKKMIQDLNMRVTMRVLPTVREPDGLAMSSRNAYLNSKQRKEAAALYGGLKLSKRIISEGTTSTKSITEKVKEYIRNNSKAKIDYISIVDTQSLRPLKKLRGRCLVVLAAWLGRTRLIDNMLVNVRR